MTSCWRTCARSLWRPSRGRTSWTRAASFPIWTGSRPTKNVQIDREPVEGRRYTRILLVPCVLLDDVREAVPLLAPRGHIIVSGYGNLATFLQDSRGFNTAPAKGVFTLVDDDVIHEGGQPLWVATLRATKHQTRTGRPKIILVADVPGWAFDINNQDMEEYLGDEFDFTHWYVSPAIGPRPTKPPLVESYDAIFIPYTRWAVAKDVPYQGALGSLRSRWFDPARPGPITEADIETVQRFMGFHVVTPRELP